MFRSPEMKATGYLCLVITNGEELHLNQVRKEERGELGVRYGPEEGDWLDLYNEDGPGDLVAYLTGGYWQVTLRLIQLNIRLVKC